MYCWKPLSKITNHPKSINYGGYGHLSYYNEKGYLAYFWSMSFAIIRHYMRTGIDRYQSTLYLIHNIEPLRHNMCINYKGIDFRIYSPLKTSDYSTIKFFLIRGKYNYSIECDSSPELLHFQRLHVCHPYEQSHSIESCFYNMDIKEIYCNPYLEASKYGHSSIVHDQI